MWLWLVGDGVARRRCFDGVDGGGIGGVGGAGGGGGRRRRGLRGGDLFPNGVIFQKGEHF